VDQTRLVNDDDLPGLEYEESKDIISLAEKELKAVSIKGLELVQVLLFPIWKIEFEYDGGNYFTYISDFSGEMVLNQGERIPGSSLPVLLTKRTMAWKRCRKFANNLKVFFTGLFYVADILAGVAYALLAQKHAGEKESWGWFFIHLGLLIIAGISFANCHKTFDTNLEENRKKGFLRASLIPLTFSLLSLLVLGLGIALTFLFPPEIVW
jgi:Na+/melibiose symporter-like transporter